MISTEARAEIDRELDKARQARANGNEGMARVCARRAAGVVVREYFASRGIASRGSAYEMLKRLVADDHAPLRARQAAELLVLRVNEASELPEGVDLLEEAQQLASVLTRD